MKWAQTGFEDRIENGLAAVRPRADDARPRPREREASLPGFISENTARIDRIAGSHQGHRRRSASKAEALGSRSSRLADKYNSKEWLDAQTKVVKDYERQEQEAWRRRRLRSAGRGVRSTRSRSAASRRKIFPAMKRVSGKVVPSTGVPHQATPATTRSPPRAGSSRSPRSKGNRRQGEPARTSSTGPLRDREEQRRPRRGPRRRLPAHGRVPEGADRSPSSTRSSRRIRSGRSGWTAVRPHPPHHDYAKQIPDFMNASSEGERPRRSGQDRAARVRRGTSARRWRASRR